MKHPLVAKKAQKIAVEARLVSDSLQKLEQWRDQSASGRKDAFRHAYWMFYTCLELGEKRAKTLGIAHEKGNERDLKRGRLEEGERADNVAIAMDYYNNQKAIELALNQKTGGKVNGILFLLDALKAGRFKIIAQNNQGQYLDKEGRILEEADWSSRQDSPRVLISSAY